MSSPQTEFHQTSFTLCGDVSHAWALSCIWLLLAMAINLLPLALIVFPLICIQTNTQTASEKDFLDAIQKVIKQYAKFSSTPRYMTYNWAQILTASIHVLASLSALTLLAFMDIYVARHLGIRWFFSWCFWFIVSCDGSPLSFIIFRHTRERKWVVFVLHILHCRLSDLTHTGKIVWLVRGD